MNNSTARLRPNALADKIAGLDDPSMGDEREREVILRAYTFGSVVSTYVFFTLGILFAVIGAGFWTIPLILGAGLASSAVPAYCKREGVDFKLVMARVSLQRLVTSYVIGALFTVAWVFAIVFHQATGHPLVRAGLGSMFGSANGEHSIVVGATFGFIGALTAFAVSRHRKLKQARLEDETAADIEDED